MFWREVLLFFSFAPHLIKTPSSPIHDLNEVKRVARYLLDVVRERQCHGVSAIQCGIPASLFLAEIPPNLRARVAVVGEKTYPDRAPRRFGVFMNARVMNVDTGSSSPDASPDDDEAVPKRFETETCISFPDNLYFIPRPLQLRVQFDTIDAAAAVALTRLTRVPVWGFYARLFEHEMDHVRGITVEDRHVSPLTVHDEDLEPAELEEKRIFLECVEDVERCRLKPDYRSGPL